ncbi:unnamed protein product [Boreogadus saida]
MLFIVIPEDPRVFFFVEESYTAAWKANLGWAFSSGLMPYLLSWLMEIPASLLTHEFIDSLLWPFWKKVSVVPRNGPQRPDRRISPVVTHINTRGTFNQAWVVATTKVFLNQVSSIEASSFAECSDTIHSENECGCLR